MSHSKLQKFLRYRLILIMNTGCLTLTKEQPGSGGLSNAADLLANAPTS